MRGFLSRRTGKPRGSSPSSSPTSPNAGRSSSARLARVGRSRSRNLAFNLDLPALEKTIQTMDVTDVEFFGTCSVFLGPRWRDIIGVASVPGPHADEVTRDQWIEYWGHRDRGSKRIGDTVSGILFDFYVCTDERRRARGRVHANDIDKLSKLVQRCWRDLSAKGTAYLASFSWWEEQLEIDSNKTLTPTAKPRPPSPQAEPRERPTLKREASADRQRRLDELVEQLQRTRTEYESEIENLKQQLREQKDLAATHHAIGDEASSASVILKLREQVNMLEEELETERSAAIFDNPEIKRLQARVADVESELKTTEGERDAAREKLKEVEKELQDLHSYYLVQGTRERFHSSFPPSLPPLPSLNADFSAESLPALLSLHSTTESSPQSPGSPKSHRSLRFSSEKDNGPGLKAKADGIPEYHVVDEDAFGPDSEMDGEVEPVQEDIKVDETVVDTSTWTTHDFYHNLGVVLDANQRQKEKAEVSKILTIVRTALRQIDISFDINARLQHHRPRKRWICTDKERFDSIFVKIVGTGNYQLVREFLEKDELNVNHVGARHSPLARAMVSQDPKLVDLLLQSDHPFDIHFGYVEKIGGTRVETDCIAYGTRMKLSAMVVLLIQYAESQGSV